MAAPLPVQRETLVEENGKPAQPVLVPERGAGDCVRSSDADATDEEAGVASATILSLVEKLPQPAARDPASELTRLEEENRRLRTLLDQARERLQLMEREAARWRQREQEYEAILEEKSELIRQLHQELQLAKERPVSNRRVPREEELIALEQELLREREQLRRDEEQLMAEIRQMEVALSRERADLARQRNELHRLHQQIQTELEMASREAALRERLGPLYELHAELQRRYFGEVRTSRRPPSAYTLPDSPANKPTSSGQDSSGRVGHPAGRSAATGQDSSSSAKRLHQPAGHHPDSAGPPRPNSARDQSSSTANQVPAASKPGFFRRLFGLSE